MQRRLHVARQRGRDAVRVDRVVVQPLGLEEDLVPLALGEAHDLVLDRRAVARPDAGDLPRVHRRAVQVGADHGVRRAASVAVMWQAICGVVIRSVRNENGSGGSSPGCSSSPAQSMVRPSSRGGVPVLSRPEREAAAARASRDRPSDGASPTRPAGIFSSPMWIRPPQERAGGQDDRARPRAAARRRARRRRPARRASSIRSSTAPSTISRPVAARRAARCIAPAVELAVGLGARARAPPGPCCG